MIIKVKRWAWRDMCLSVTLLCVTLQKDDCSHCSGIESSAPLWHRVARKKRKGRERDNIGGASSKRRRLLPNELYYHRRVSRTLYSRQRRERWAHSIGTRDFDIPYYDYYWWKKGSSGIALEAKDISGTLLSGHVSGFKLLYSSEGVLCARAESYDYEQ